ncbi:hypothetical protein HMPREF0972_02474 [Actinomyces sp. oral taxon 848 str. F0332]|nr:hypothetical protein HMPREF0972_02474 [Actinomyces sp. oral taxon 848 str. F0332]
MHGMKVVTLQASLASRTNRGEASPPTLKVALRRIFARMQWGRGQAAAL